MPTGFDREKYFAPSGLLTKRFSAHCIGLKMICLACAKKIHALGDSTCFNFFRRYTAVLFDGLCRYHSLNSSWPCAALPSHSVSDGLCLKESLVRRGYCRNLQLPTLFYCHDIRSNSYNGSNICVKYKQALNKLG